MDDTGLRSRAIDETKRVGGCRPGAATGCGACSRRGPTGASRASGRGACRSRAFTCRSCGTAVLTTELVARAADVFERDGAEAWYERPIEDFLPAGSDLPGVRRHGVRARAGHPRRVVRLRVEPRGRPGGAPRAAVARGSLPRGHRPVPRLVPELDAGGARRRAGARRTDQVRHARVRRHRRRQEDVEVPRQRRAARTGHRAERRRGPAAVGGSVDYREEVRFGTGDPRARRRGVPQDAEHVPVSLVANLSDFNPATDMVPPLDHGSRSIGSRWRGTRELAAKVIARPTTQYDFPAIFQAVNAFVTVDLSAFYVDVLEGPALHAGAPTSRARRSAQTAMYAIADGLARLLAPILLGARPRSTGRTCPARARPSVHLRRVPGRRGPGLADEALDARWTRLLTLRAAVNAGLEEARQEKVIGQSLEARVTFKCDRRRSRDLLDALPGPSCRCCSSRRRSTTARRRRRAKRRPAARCTSRRGSAVQSSPRGWREKCERCWTIRAGRVERTWPRGRVPALRGRARRRPMSGVAHAGDSRRWPRPAALARMAALVAVLVVLDQVTKVLVRARGLRSTTACTVIPGFLNLVHVHNTGVAFGVPERGATSRSSRCHWPPSRRRALVGHRDLRGASVAARAAGADRPGARSRRGDRATSSIALRQRHRGRFRGRLLGGWHFWAFNVADAAITLGRRC